MIRGVLPAAALLLVSTAAAVWISVTPASFDRPVTVVFPAGFDRQASLAAAAQSGAAIVGEGKPENWMIVQAADATQIDALYHAGAVAVMKAGDAGCAGTVAAD